MLVHRAECAGEAAIGRVNRKLTGNLRIFPVLKVLEPVGGLALDPILRLGLGVEAAKLLISSRRKPHQNIPTAPDHHLDWAEGHSVPGVDHRKTMRHNRPTR